MKDYHPILTCAEAAQFEKQLLDTNQQKIWEAMSHVGCQLGALVMQDYLEMAPFPKAPKILILAGVGHNAGDAFLAASTIAKAHPSAEVSIIFALGRDKLSPLTQKALEELNKTTKPTLLNALEPSSPYDICLDGIFGMSFRLPLSSELINLITQINNDLSINLRAAVDLPSGLGDQVSEVCFRADFTYATGVAKYPLFNHENEKHVGRIRYVDIGFFIEKYTGAHSSHEYLLTSDCLSEIGKLRASNSNKFTFGHLLILSGSKQYPGALLMTVRAALRTGLGLVTVCAPESLVPEFALAVPEAMWIPWPENPEGGLSDKGTDLLKDILPKATAIVMGPGMGGSEEAMRLVATIIETVAKPILLDASALRKTSIEALDKRPEDFPEVLLTPHAGELKRISNGEVDFKNWSQKKNIITLLKGSVSRIGFKGEIFNSTFGSPVLARGGSGDILSGMAGSLLAQEPKEPCLALCRAVVWHGLASQYLARECGQVGVQTTQIIDYFGKALRSL